MAGMQRIHTGQSLPLHDIAATRRIEQSAAQALPAHTLMQRAGLAAARLAMALKPHARHIWIACGPGNNGGDGLEAARHLHQWGFPLTATWLGNTDSAPPDTRAAWARAENAGIRISSEPPAHADLCIDALLGIGASRAPQGLMAEWIRHMHRSASHVLAIDVPSGLNADTGMPLGAESATVHAHDTLSLLTLKPGLFTGQGRDAAGTVWFDTLDVIQQQADFTAFLNEYEPDDTRLHASHKGSYGTVAVVGGAPGMAGAALLAARAALHSGAGRVFVALLDGSSAGVDANQPELMLRPVHSLDFPQLSVVCGCGGGDAVRTELPRALSSARQLVLDADALNAIAADTQLQSLLVSRGRLRTNETRPTVLTPHPLEAARLLACSTADIQADRLKAAQSLAERFGATVVLKGSGTVIASPGELPRIHHGGNARLATAGTGDVLAGMLGARLAQGGDALRAACQAVAHHAHLADTWPLQEPLTASRLAQASQR